MLYNILKMSQKQLFRHIEKLYDGRIAAIERKQYILVRGEAPIMLVAHLDTVHKEPVKTICTSEDRNILMSPQGIGGDDRCGVFSLMSIYKDSKVKPWLLFTCDEEIGGRGAVAFCDDYAKGFLPEELADLKMIVELDRKGSDDAVYYDCDNKDFETYITRKGFRTSFGSFSDISYIAPDLGVAAVNLSCGYYNAHTQHEYICVSDMKATIDKVLVIIEDTTCEDAPQYEYVEADYLKSYQKSWECGGKVYYYSGSKNYSDSAAFSYVPQAIREEYIALLAYYTVSELEDIRAEMGDTGIMLLYQSECLGGYREGQQ